MKQFLPACLLGLLPLTAFSQSSSCFYPADGLAAQRSRLDRNLAAEPAARRSVQYVPLRFHLVADSEGQGRIRKRPLLDLLCQLNDDFAAGGIQFYLHGDDLFGETIQNDAVFEQSANTANFQMEAGRDTGAINLFIVESIDNPGTAFLEGTYYTPLHHWIVATKDVIQPAEYFISHEVGHFFSLLHTFHGWDQPFTPGSPGWPVAPASIGGYPVELADGSNCTQAGDLICDTPPDYIFGATQTGCLYTGGALDPNGQPVDPMENNMMGYFQACSPYLFTPGQFAVMNADLAAPAQANLDLDFVPAATAIATPPNLLVSPPPSFLFPGNTDIALDWLDVAGATHYLVEVDLLPTFVSPAFREFVTTESALVISQPLIPDQLYRWRVRPFNAHVGCAEAVSGLFRTGPAVSGVQGLPGGGSFRLSPNPVAGDGVVQMQLELTRRAEVSLTVCDATGRQLYVENRTLNAGPNNWPLPAGNLATGINWLILHLEGRKLVSRTLKSAP